MLSSNSGTLEIWACHGNTCGTTTVGGPPRLDSNFAEGVCVLLIERMLGTSKGEGGVKNLIDSNSCAIHQSLIFVLMKIGSDFFYSSKFQNRFSNSVMLRYEINPECQQQYRSKSSKKLWNAHEKGFRVMTPADWPMISSSQWPQSSTGSKRLRGQSVVDVTIFFSLYLRLH